MIRDYQAVSRTWFPKGKQKIIPTYGKHRGAKLIGALDYESGEVFCVQEKQYKTKEFLAFLKKLLVRYKGEKIVVILDNATTHHGKILKPFLKANKKLLTLVYLPPYSPQLNLIEGLWGWLKKAVINNVFFKNISQIARAVEEFIDHINETPEITVDRLCVQL